jgi:hypothetical protein
MVDAIMDHMVKVERVERAKWEKEVSVGKNGITIMVMIITSTMVRVRVKEKEKEGVVMEKA